MGESRGMKQTARIKPKGGEETVSYPAKSRLMSYSDTLKRQKVAIPRTSNNNINQRARINDNKNKNNNWNSHVNKMFVLKTSVTSMILDA